MSDWRELVLRLSALLSPSSFTLPLSFSPSVSLCLSLCSPSMPLMPSLRSRSPPGAGQWVEVARAQRKRWRGRPRGAPSLANRQSPQLPASQKPAAGLFRQLSRALSLGLLRLGFLLGLGSHREEQGQVPGTSAGMQGSFPRCRQRPGRSASWDPGVKQPQS